MLHKSIGESNPSPVMTQDYEMTFVLSGVIVCDFDLLCKYSECLLRRCLTVKGSGKKEKKFVAEFKRAAKKSPASHLCCLRK